MSHKFRPLVLAVNAALFAMASGSVFAQAAAPAKTSAAPASSGIEEVIVTARKTEESVQVVPVSVTALSSEALTKAAVLDVQDLRSSVPGLFVATSSQGGAPTFAIRAAKADNGTSDTVTAYIGDMPVASTKAVANMVYDMQSISVLKGPQGTLFGANSTGGAIIFRPNTPSNTFEGYAEVGVANFNRSSFQGMVNIPINDVLQVRLAGEVVDRDKGFQKNHTPTNGNTEMGNDKHESARLSIRLKPSSAWTNDFVFDYFHEDDQPYQDAPVALRPRFNYTTFLQKFVNPANPAAGTVPFTVPVDYSRYPGIIVGDPKNVTVGGSPTWSKAKIWDGVYTLNYEISDTASFKNVLGYQDIKLDTFQDNDATPFAGVNGRTTQDIKQWTLEPSVDWKTEDGRFRNKTGFFYSDKKIQTGNSYTVIGLPWDLTDPSVTGALVPLGPTPAFWIPGNFAVPALYPIQSDSFYWRQFKSHAVYTQFSYDLSKELTATLGLRYTWDKATYSASNKLGFGTAGVLAGQGNMFTGSCAAALAAYPKFDAAACRGGADTKSQAPSFTFTLEDKFSDRSMAYATIRGGYLVGGFNNQAQPAATGIDFTFKPEKVVDFETGVKSDWELWNRPIRTNLAVFYSSYKDQQRVQNGTTATGTTFIGVVNAGASTAYGLDLDVTYEVTDNLEMTLGWNHVESEYTKFNAIVNIPGKFAYVDLSGQPMSQTPKDIVNLSATVKWPLSSEVGKVSSTLGYFWTDKTLHHDSPTYDCNTNPAGQCTSVIAGTDFTAYDKLPAYDLWNFTTEWKSIMGSAFDANFWVKNLMDKKYKTYGSNQMLQYGYATYTFGPPRQFGLNVRYNF